MDQELPADNHVSDRRRSLSILDLMLATLIVAVHFFHFPLAVRYRGSGLMLLVPFVPTLITIWIHHRARLTLLQATCLHYAVSVSWGFFYGYGYALASIQERGSSYFGDPLSMGTYIATEMVGIALITSCLYSLIAWCIGLAKRKRPARRKL